MKVKCFNCEKIIDIEELLNKKGICSECAEKESIEKGKQDELG